MEPSKTAEVLNKAIAMFGDGKDLQAIPDPESTRLIMEHGAEIRYPGFKLFLVRATKATASGRGFIAFLFLSGMDDLTSSGGFKGRGKTPRTAIRDTLLEMAKAGARLCDSGARAARVAEQIVRGIDSLTPADDLQSEEKTREH